MDPGREEPTILLSNERQASQPKLITRYAQRMLIENSLRPPDLGGGFLDAGSEGNAGHVSGVRGLGRGGWRGEKWKQK